MPRYYFDLVNSEIVSDEPGQDLPDDVTAMDIAELVAQRLSREQPDLTSNSSQIQTANAQLASHLGGRVNPENCQRLIQSV
jgi:hypothetical protein